MRASICFMTTVIFATAFHGCDPAQEVDELGQVVAPVKTVCASGSTIFGIDVSKWQGTIDWARVKAAGVKYAFIRVSDGISTIDDKFVPNWVGAGAQGIPRGVYQFFRAHRDPLVQADIVIDHLLQYGVGELPPVIDVEATNDQPPETIARNVGIWIDRVEAALGVTPIIYTGSYFWDGNVRSTAYAGYPLWIAHYTPAACPLIPNAWSKWTFWQYGDTGRVDGISGNVDVNRFDGTEADLLALAGDPVCRVDPNHQACSGTHVQVCSAERRLTLIPCNGGTVCAKKVAGAGYMCMDPRCSGTVGENGRLCATESARAECVAGTYTELPCGTGEACENGACVDVGPVEPVEPGPEAVEVEPIEPGPETVEVEPGPEAVEVVEVVEESGAYALGASRSVSGSAITSGGCGAGHGLWWGLGLLVLRRRSR